MIQLSVGGIRTEGILLLRSIFKLHDDALLLLSDLLQLHQLLQLLLLLSDHYNMFLPYIVLFLAFSGNFLQKIFQSIRLIFKFGKVFL